MRKSTVIITAVSVIVLLGCLSACTCMADSMLSSNPSGEDTESHSLEEVGDMVPPNPNYTGAKAVKGCKIWGPGVKYCKPQKKAATKVPAVRYPAIRVRYKAYLGKAGGKKYKSYSSRGRYQLISVNITPIIIREAKKYRIPPLLLKAIIQTESTYNTYAVGPTGALGLCQLKPSTARGMGVRDPFNPEQNIAGGAKYLSYLYRKFGGNLNKAIAAYNVGPYGVRNGIPSYGWRFVRTVRRRMHW